MEIPSLFFEEHPNPMLIYDIDTLEVIEVNKSAVRKYGYSQKEFTRLSIKDIRPPEDIPKLQDKLSELGEDSKISDIGIFRHQTKSGDLLYVQITAQSFPLNGRNTRISHIHDVTETLSLKAEVEQALNDQRHHIDNNPLAMVKYDKNFRIIEWSKRAEEKTGFSKQEVLGTSIFDLNFIDDEEAAKVKKRLLKLSSGEEDLDRFETMLRLKDGKPLEVLLHASALNDRKGEFKSVLAFIENISERKEYERQLVQREKKYHQLFEDANDGIFLMDGLTFIDCNQRVTELFKASKDEIIGKSPLDFSPEVQPDGMLSKERVEQKVRLAGQGTPQVFEWKHTDANGDAIDVEVSVNTINLGGDRYTQAMIRDITEHNENISKLRAAEETLQNSLNEKEVLLSEIHHRVKNNLAIISGLLELESMNWNEGSAVHKVLTQSKLRIFSMASIHEQLYKFKDFATLNLEDYISELVGTIFDSMKGQKKGVEATIDCDNITLNINQAVPCALIVNELVTNSLKYAYEGENKGELEVKSKQKDEVIAIVVRDNGPGLPDEFKKMTMKSLGHQLVNQLVKQLEGEIDVESGKEGTRYEIRFRKDKKAGSSSKHFT